MISKFVTLSACLITTDLSFPFSVPGMSDEEEFHIGRRRRVAVGPSHGAAEQGLPAGRHNFAPHTTRDQGEFWAVLVLRSLWEVHSPLGLQVADSAHGEDGCEMTGFAKVCWRLDRARGFH